MNAERTGESNLNTWRQCQWQYTNDKCSMALAFKSNQTDDGTNDFITSTAADDEDMWRRIRVSENYTKENAEQFEILDIFQSS